LTHYKQPFGGGGGGEVAGVNVIFVMELRTSNVMTVAIGALQVDIVEE